MTSRERFLAALQHRPADRAPIDYLAAPEADARLREHLGVETEEALLDALGCDFFYLPGRDISQNEGISVYYHGPQLAMTQTERVCPLGIRWRRGAFDSKFAVDDAIEGPFALGATSKDILAHRWPTPADFDFSPLVGICEAQADRVIIGGLWTGILGDSYRMYSFERFLADMVEKPEVIHTLIDRMTEMYLQLNEAVFATLSDRLDVWFFGNDFGHQNGLLFSPNMWADFFGQNIRKLTGQAHRHGKRVMMHSCGAVARLIPLFIEAGVDILDPVQVTAAGMEPTGLKASFGDSIVFHGGIDVQHVLPTATRDQAYRHARQMIETLGPGGGYIVGPSQIFQTDILPANVVEVYRAASETTTV